jgi:energy-coupling factor transport system permease protein
MQFSFYIPGRSPLHRLDPRPKLFLLLAALLLAVATAGPLAPAVLLVAGLVGIGVAGAWPALRRVRGLITTVFLASIAIWSLPALAVILAGGARAGARPAEAVVLMRGVAAGLKLAAMIVCSVLFLATTRNEELTLGLIRLGLPYPAAFAFSTALRLVPAFVGAAMMILSAQKSRGLDAETGSWLARARNHVPLLVPIVASTLRSTNTFAMALEARGFRARPGRTSLLTLRLTPGDWTAIAIAAALLALALRLRWIGA